MQKLNFGCGLDVRDGWDNVDCQKDKRLSKSFDFDVFPYPIKNDTYDYVLANQVLEHLDRPERVLEELHRICKNGAIIHIEVPYYNNRGAYADITHRHYFAGAAFVNFAQEHRSINKKQMFDVISARLTPTGIGKFLPKKLREKLSLFVGGLIGKVVVEFRVKK